MRHPPVLALLFVCAAVGPSELFAAEPARRLAFERGGAVRAANLDGTQPRNARTPSASSAR